MTSPLKTGPLTPKFDFSHIKRHPLREYAIRFAFGAGISAAAAAAGALFGAKIGGVLLGFPAILPASLTMIERQSGRHQAMADATGAVLGSLALIAFAVVATVLLGRSIALVALLVATAAWLAVAVALYVLIVWLPRRRKREVKRAKPTNA